MMDLIISRLKNNKYDAYYVGGAVRDILLEKTPSDYDIVTNASPEEIINVFKDQKVDTVGKSFGVCLVNGVEIATYRKDKYFGLSDKNCVIEIAETLEEDLARRDLTINAIAMDPIDHKIVDPFSGKTDLKNNLIRFVGDPDNRIYEDPCRIIRAVRFASQIGSYIENETYEALKRNSHLIKDYVANERIRLEIFKAIKIRKASPFFRYLCDIGAMDYIFPSLNECFISGGKYHVEDVIDHNMYVGDAISTKCPLTKLTGYIHDIGKPYCEDNGSFIDHDKIGSEIIIDEMKNLAFSNFEIERISGLIRMHMRSIKRAKGRGVRRALSKMDVESVPYREWLRLKFADATGNIKKGPHPFSMKKYLVRKMENELMNNDVALNTNQLEISGNDVMEIMNIQTGPKVGRYLKLLYYRVIENPSLNQEECLLQLLKNWRIIHESKNNRFS